VRCSSGGTGGVGPADASDGLEVRVSGNGMPGPWGSFPPSGSELPRPRVPLEQPIVRFVEPPPRVGRVPRVVVILVVGLALALAFAAGGRWVAARAAFAPPAGVEEARVPLGVPPIESAQAHGPHAFSEVQADGATPVAYDPCRPIHYVVRTLGEPPGGEALIATAVERVSAATGLRFVDDGTTVEAPDPHRSAYQPDRYGKRWAPVLVTWSDDRETPQLAGDVAGLGGSASVTRDGERVYVTGAVTLDASEITRLLTTPNGTAVALGVVSHEFGHLVGLDHVDDPTQLMYPSTNVAVTTFASGDLEGLRDLGEGRCAPHL
jgi:hypothetical protein